MPKPVATSDIRWRFKAALADRGHTVASWSRDHGLNDAEVWHALAGRREYPEIRSAIADVLGLTRATVDRLIADRTNGPEAA